MSIRTQILIPLLALVVVAVSIAAFSSWRSRLDQMEVAAITDKSISAGELSRKAHEDFARLGELVSEVTAMTHFIDAATVQKRFGDGVASMEADLTGLLAAAQSPEMTKLDRDGADRFALWRAEAEGLLGVKPVTEIATIDLVKRDGLALETLLNSALDLAGHDARAKLVEVAANTRVGTNALLVFAILFGLVGAGGAVWLAGNLARPLKALVAGAERLAGGDVEVAFDSLGRSDEIGEISRAVARFRDNVRGAQSAETAAARDREAAEEARRRDAVGAAARAEQARVVESLGAALNRLAAGDLTFRVTQEFAAEYARLKTDFNASLETLQQAMTGIVGAADEMLDGSKEISGMAGDLSRRTGEQSASIEEAAAALEEITATVKTTAEGAGQAREIVSRTRQEAEKSGEVVRTAVDAIARIQNSSREINKIVNVIDEIAFQTNLLALNAGVEAARAGDSGRGFAVVATEVRALAQRSSSASKEIKTLIAASNANVDQGVELVTSAGAALDRIFSQVTEIDRVVTTIAGGAGEQASGLQSVNAGVSDIDRATQRNTAMAEKTTSASESLAARAQDLVRSIGRFQIGRAPERATPPARRAVEEPRRRRA